MCGRCEDRQTYIRGGCVCAFELCDPKLNLDSTLACRGCGLIGGCRVCGHDVSVLADEANVKHWATTLAGRKGPGLRDRFLRRLKKFGKD